MKQIKMKIRPQFLDLIRNGVKKHEYRLDSKKYEDIHVGDVICLLNNQNPNDYVKVVVNKILKYSSWDDAFKNRWIDDFKGLYNSYEDLLKECYKFYNKSEVDEHGIVVYEIEEYKPQSIKGARFLFDTNIIVQRESFSNVNDEIAMMFNGIEKMHGQMFFHPLTRQELDKYADKNIKENMLIKLKAYTELVPLKESYKDFEEVCFKYSLDDNSRIDNEILLQVFNGRVDYLITEDRAILRKAEELLIKERVLTCNELLQKIEEENPQLIDYDVLSVKLVKIGTLDFNDCFFDTLREDYGGSSFNRWLERKSSEDAYVFRNSEGLQGFLYLKSEDENEDYSDISPTFSPKKRLKVGTFKINSTGLRLGERFLKIVFDNALKRNVDEVYVTLFEDKRSEVKVLKDQMQEWGFVKTSKKRNGEIVLVKDMKHYDASKSPKFNYPLFKTENGIGILPILARYHTKMFPDLHLSNENMEIFNEACSYAIEKIYVCASKNVIHKPGTILFIYRMAEYNKRYRSVISGIAILNEVKYATSVDDLLNECKNRSIFSENELKRFYNQDSYKTIVKVLLLKSFDKKVNLNNIYDNNILSESIGPTIRAEISIDGYQKLMNLGFGDEYNGK